MAEIISPERRELLACVAPDLSDIHDRLRLLSDKYCSGMEERIGWEILQAARALEEAKRLADVYLNENLPSVSDVRGIYNKS